LTEKQKTNNDNRSSTNDYQIFKLTFSITEKQKTNNEKRTTLLLSTSPSALMVLAIENNKEKNGSDHHSKEARRATSVAERLPR
jgi:hypothetical protein